MLHILLFFSSRCLLFHSVTFFGSCNIHILNTGVLKFKRTFRRQRVKNAIHIYIYIYTYLLTSTQYYGNFLLLQWKLEVDVWMIIFYIRLLNNFENKTKYVLINDIYFNSFCKYKPYNVMPAAFLAGVYTLLCIFLFHPQHAVCNVVFHVFMTT